MIISTGSQGHQMAEISPVGKSTLTRVRLGDRSAGVMLIIRLPDATIDSVRSGPCGKRKSDAQVEIGGKLHLCIVMSWQMSFQGF